MDQFTHTLLHYFLSLGIKYSVAIYLNMAGLLIAAIFIITIVEYTARFLLIEIFSQYAKKSKTNFDDLLVENKVPKAIAHFIPLVVGMELTSYVFVDFSRIENIVEKGLDLYIIILILSIVKRFLHSIRDHSKTLPNLKDKPIHSYVQVFMIFAWLIGIMYAYSYLTGTSMGKFFTILGATSAVIILVFKDMILGFIASIQVSINDMVRINDWITFEKYGADGDVIEITLATVKVQNFDKTITTIPTYALISDSFKNWRGMEESDGRRIKRPIYIKQNSVKFLSQEEVEKLQSIALIQEYLVKRQNDINDYNSKQNIDKSLGLNGRNLTNLGLFRKYIDTYLNHHSGINKNMTMMVRQLSPTPTGIPIELYTFTSDKVWKNYEYIMADIFDHVIAAAPYFQLEIFEFPNNSNFEGISVK